MKFSAWICELLFGVIGANFPSREEFNLIFDKFEILLSVAFRKYNHRGYVTDWSPLGIFFARHRNLNSIMEAISGSLDRLKEFSPYVDSQLFGVDFKEANENFLNFKAHVSKHHRY
jgi:hypothetical protein